MRNRNATAYRFLAPYLLIFSVFWVWPIISSFMIAVTWRWAGYNAIILLAGMQSIPEDVYEAATLDRVSKLKQFFYITLPLLKPVIVFCLVLSIIGTMARLLRNRMKSLLRRR